MLLTVHHWWHLTKSLIMVHLISAPSLLILSLSTHVTVQDAHEVATKVTNFSPWHRVDFINSIERIQLWEHF